MSWRIGGQLGIGNTFSAEGEADNFTMSQTLGFDLAIGQSPWRAGIECGAMNQAIADYFFEEDAPDVFVRPNFIYAGVFADYGFHVGKLPFFVRAGLGPAQQTDVYVHHVEQKVIPFLFTGAGLDYDYGKFMLQGFLSPSGDFVLTVSLGLYVGKMRR